MLLFIDEVPFNQRARDSSSRERTKIPRETVRFLVGFFCFKPPAHFCTFSAHRRERRASFAQAAWGTWGAFAPSGQKGIMQTGAAQICAAAQEPSGAPSQEGRPRSGFRFLLEQSLSEGRLPYKSWPRSSQPTPAGACFGYGRRCPSGWLPSNDRCCPGPT